MTQLVNIMDMEGRRVLRTVSAARAVAEVVGSGHDVARILGSRERRLKYGLFPITTVGAVGRFEVSDGYDEIHDWEAGESLRTLRAKPMPAEARAELLTALVDEARDAIDQAAEAARQRYLTPGSGQAMVYQRKADEARACMVAATPDPADYPYLAAEIGVTADTLRGVADVVLARETAWTQASAAIEGLRLAAKRDIAEAATAEEVQAVLDGVSFPAPEA